MKKLLVLLPLMLSACTMEVQTGNQPPAPPQPYFYHQVLSVLSDGFVLKTDMWLFHEDDDRQCVRDTVNAYFSDLDEIDIREMADEYEVDLARALRSTCGDDVYVQNIKVEML